MGQSEVQAEVGALPWHWKQHTLSRAPTSPKQFLHPAVPGIVRGRGICLFRGQRLGPGPVCRERPACLDPPLPAQDIDQGSFLKRSLHA